MALFKILKGNESNLPTTKTPGYMYITEDQGNIFVDLSTTERIQLNAKNAATSNKWAAPITLSLSGDASGSTTIDGSANANITVTVKDDSHNHVISNIDNLQTTLDSKASKDVATQSANGLMSSTDKTKLDGIAPKATPVYYGECSTAAATAAKVVAVDDSFTLVKGAQVTIKFTTYNSVNSPTLNVNNTGAKPMYRYGTTPISSNVAVSGWTSGVIQTFTYDGTGWVREYWNNTTYSNPGLGQGYGICSTAEATTAKTASLSSYSLSTGGIVAVKFTNAVPASSTLNVNNKGAKSIYYRGAAIENGIIKAGDIATFIYNGSQYHLIAIDRWQEDTAASINNLSVNGKVITYTKNDGTTGTITTQDTNTTSFTITANANDDDVVVLTGTNGTNAVTYKATHALKGPSTTANTTKGATADVTVDAAGESGSIKVPKVTVDKYGHTTGLTEQTLSISIPSAIKNPNALTFGSKTYDGSSAQSITAADLGLASAMKFLGTTTSAITDGATTNPVVIDGVNVTATAGNVVINGNKEFVLAANGKWEELGNEGNYKVVQTAKADPTASGTAITFIDTISQNTQGVITATKKTVQSASQTVAGLLSAADKKKLDGIAENANNYSLPTASNTTLGGVKTTSTVTSTSGLIPTPIINGVPYYKDTTYSLSSFGITATKDEINVLDGITATTAELNYVDGVTSNIQTQLNGKQATITGGASSITSTNLTASRALISNSSGKVAVSDITSTELGYLDGVTSNIQTQLNNKRSNTAPASGAWFNGTPLVDTNGIMEVGKAIDFHNATGLTNDYSTRIIIGGDGGNILTLPTATGVIALTSSSITGNAATATTLQVARKINGTSFNGSADITTANWGTARDITIADSDATNTGTAVSVNGSAAVTLKLPATIKATLSGNASTATKLASAKTITLTGDVSGSVSFDGSDNVSITTTVADDSHAHVIANIDGLETQINTINTSLASKLSAVFHYGATAPSDTNLLWIDSTATTGGLKFYNGSAWTHVPVCWS